MKEDMPQYPIDSPKRKRSGREREYTQTESTELN